MGKKVTIQDIARIAGVSKATVSRVLNQKQNVDPETREQILKIMQEHGFVPSITASSLATGRMHMIGVLAPSLTWPMVPEFMRGVGDTIGRTSYEIILYSITDAHHEQDRSEVIDRIIASKLVAGLLAVYPGPSAQHLKDLHTPDFPVVLIDDQEQPPENVHWLGVDNRHGAYLATRHLIQLGHRRIAHIQGPQRHLVSRERRQGYYDALAEAGIPCDSTLVHEGDFMPPSGFTCTSALLTLPERPTAIFAGSDYMAYGALKAVLQYGLRVPQDIALIGFDDITTSAYLEPALTTVQQPFYQMGEQASTLLLSLLLDDPTSQDIHTTSIVRRQITPTLVIRQSCGA